MAVEYQYLGTGAAEGMPATFCACPVCLRSMREGGKSLRMRACTLLGDDVLIDNTWRTLPQALRGLNDSVYTFWGQIFAFSAMITLPILVIFLAFQKQFVQSVAMSGIKG